MKMNLMKFCPTMWSRFQRIYLFAAFTSFTKISFENRFYINVKNESLYRMKFCKNNAANNSIQNETILRYEWKKEEIYMNILYESNIRLWISIAKLLPK